MRTFIVVSLVLSAFFPQLWALPTAQVSNGAGLSSTRIGQDEGAETAQGGSASGPGVAPLTTTQTSAPTTSGGVRGSEDSDTASGGLPGASALQSGASAVASTPGKLAAVLPAGLSSLGLPSVGGLMS